MVMCTTKNVQLLSEDEPLEVFVIAGGVSDAKEVDGEWHKVVQVGRRAYRHCRVL